MISKFRAYCKSDKTIYEVLLIDFKAKIEQIKLRKTGNIWYDFEDVVLMQSTGVYDKHDVEIFEGDIIQQVHAYDYATLEIETDFLEPFEVKKGNYVQGKWIAEEVDGENYSVVRYVFGKDMKVIGNIYENTGLLEAT